MTEKCWLYFALGVTSVISLGNVFNQIVPLATDGGIALSDTGIAFPDGTVQTTAAGGDPRRAFYLTNSEYYGYMADGFNGDGSGVCATGFHFASLWELLGVSNLRYATDEEGGDDVFRHPDSGRGPPSAVSGWIRTGYVAQALSVEGANNCENWTSTNIDHRGTIVRLGFAWGAATGDGDPSVVIAPWDSSFDSCLANRSVWCVEN